MSSKALGDCWRVTIEQWERVTEPDADSMFHGGGPLPDYIAHVIAYDASGAATIAEDACVSKHGPMARVKAVEYVGVAFGEVASDD